jgi:hypothetical protein
VHYGITQSQHCNNDNNDNMMCVSAGFEFFGGLLQCQHLGYMGKKCDNKEGD